MVSQLSSPKLTRVLDIEVEKGAEDEEDADHEQDCRPAQQEAELLLHRILHLLLILLLPFLPPRISEINAIPNLSNKPANWWAALDEYNFLFILRIYTAAMQLVRGAFPEKFEKFRYCPGPGLEPTTERKSKIILLQNAPHDLHCHRVHWLST